MSFYSCEDVELVVTVLTDGRTVTEERDFEGRESAFYEWVCLQFVLTKFLFGVFFWHADQPSYFNVQLMRTNLLHKGFTLVPKHECADIDGNVI